MTLYETQYKGTVMRLGLALLLFEALFMLQGVVLGIAAILLPLFFTSLTSDVLYEVIGGLLYIATFCLPVAFFRVLSKKHMTVEPIRSSWRMPRETFPYIFFGLAVVSAAAYANALLVDAFSYREFNNEVLFDASASSNVELVLLFFTLAVIPAFVEELLFRGLVLSNLLPYGRTTAILASGVLFGIMHQNAGQLFYATAAGIVLGFVYVKTKSIWPCVLLHFCNNFRSVLQVGIADRLPAQTANVVLYTMEGVLLVAALISAVYLFLRERDTRVDVRRYGAFERELAPDEEYAERPIAPARRFRLFFTPTIIAFLVLCGIQTFSLITLSFFS